MCIYNKVFRVSGFGMETIAIMGSIIKAGIVERWAKWQEIKLRRKKNTTVFLIRFADANLAPLIMIESVNQHQRYRLSCDAQNRSRAMSCLIHGICHQHHKDVQLGPSLSAYYLVRHCNCKRCAVLISPFSLHAAYIFLNRY